MKIKRKLLKTILLIEALAPIVWGVGSSGFSTQLVGAKALGQGNAFVAEADDPSAVYFNPAGMTQLSGTQVTVGAVGLVPFTQRTGGSSPDDVMKRQFSALPDFYVTHLFDSFRQKYAIGLGLTAPYGLTTEWNPTSSVRYISTKSALQMVNVNPSMAIEVTPELSLGVGADYVNLLNTVAQSQINQALANGDTSADGTAKSSGHGQGWGYNGGLLYKPSPQHSFAISYRSQIKIPIKGDVELSGLSSSSQFDYDFSGGSYKTDATSSVVLPATLLAGYAFKWKERWTFLADYEWTGWNSFQSQDVSVQETDPSRLAFITGNPASNTFQVARHWKNTSSVGLGANYKASEKWQYRGGYAFFQNAVPDSTFSPDIPDSSIHTVTAGFSRLWKSIVFDFALNGYFYENRSVSNGVGNAVGASADGEYKTFVPALALSVTYRL
jgi:long-chain fatty acid transport protein